MQLVLVHLHLGHICRIYYNYLDLGRSLRLNIDIVVHLAIPVGLVVDPAVDLVVFLVRSIDQLMVDHRLVFFPLFLVVLFKDSNCQIISHVFESIDSLNAYLHLLLVS